MAGFEARSGMRGRMDSVAIESRHGSSSRMMRPLGKLGTVFLGLELEWWLDSKSVTSKKLPNVSKSCPTVIPLEK